jgi:hypothetical protein
VHDSRSSPFASDEIKFPTYWQRPVWLQARGPDEGETGVIELVWEPAYRRREQAGAGLRTGHPMIVAAADIAQALASAWHTFQQAAHDEEHGWDITSAAAEVQPQEAEPPAP